MTVQSGTSRSPAASEAARLAMALGRVTRSIRRRQSLPLGHGGVSALATVSREGPIRAGELAAREGLAPASLSRLIALLVVDGYIERRADPADRRSFLVSSTPAGEALLDEIRSTTARVLLDMLERLNPTDRDRIMAALPALEVLADDTSEPATTDPSEAG